MSRCRLRWLFRWKRLSHTGHTDNVSLTKRLFFKAFNVSMLNSLIITSGSMNWNDAKLSKSWKNKGSINNYECISCNEDNFTCEGYPESSSLFLSLFSLLLKYSKTFTSDETSIVVLRLSKVLNRFNLNKKKKLTN